MLRVAFGVSRVVSSWQACRGMRAAFALSPVICTASATIVLCVSSVICATGPSSGRQEWDLGENLEPGRGFSGCRQGGRDGNAAHSAASEGAVLYGRCAAFERVMCGVRLGRAAQMISRRFLMLTISDSGANLAFWSTGAIRSHMA